MKPLAITLIGLLDDGNVKAFIEVIRAGEGTSDDDGYRRHFGGELFNSFGDHPRRAITKRLGKPARIGADGNFIAASGQVLTSTAAGVGQFLARTWDECAEALGLRDFSPKNQLLAIVFLIRRRKALDDVLAGRFADAVRKTNREWASLPGSPYGQPVRTMAQAEQTYREHGGVMRAQSAPAPVEVRELPVESIAAAPADSALLHTEASATPVQDPPPQELSPEPTMPLPAILAAVLPSLFSVIPELVKTYGSGSAMSERNAKGVEILATVAKDAIGAKNEQELAETIDADPQAAQTVREAVKEHWFEIVEAGGGGIDGARKADAAIMQMGGPWWDFLRSPSFWALLLLTPLVYLFVGSLIGLWGTATWSDDVRAGLAGSITSAVIGGAVGYYWGQTTSRNRAPAAAPT